MPSLRPLEIDCPEWHEAIDESRKREFAELLCTVIRSVDALAAASHLKPAMVRDWHFTLFRNFVPIPVYAGNFRQDDPARPCLGYDVRVGTASGASFSQVVELVDLLFEDARVSLSRIEIHWPYFTPAERAKRLSVIIAEFVGRFIRIHPFVNGNGRISRLIWWWTLLRFGVKPQVGICPRPPAPYSDIMDACMRGNNAPLALAVLYHLTSSRPSIEQ